jgi:hypothetical protein
VGSCSWRRLSASSRATRRRLSLTTCGSVFGRYDGGAGPGRWRSREPWPRRGRRSCRCSKANSSPTLSGSCFPGTGRAWLAGPDLDAAADQDPDRAPVPHELHHPGCRCVTQTARLELPGPRQRAIEPSGTAVVGWGRGTWPSVEGPWRRSTPGSSSRTRPDSR